MPGISLPQLLFLALAFAFLLGSGLWLLVPAWYGVPWVPAHRQRIRKALELAGLQPGETLYDLGCGDGRALLIAVEEFGAQAVGIEVGPAQCLWGWLRCSFSGSRRRVRMRCGDFYHADVSAAQVVFVYLTSTQTARLKRKLARELRPGARVVSLAADFPGWQPAKVDRENMIFYTNSRSCSMSNTADVIIIGAGVHGASLAFHLAERGAKPLVLEKDVVGAGATGRSSGLVRMHYDVRQDSQLAWVSFGYFREWSERVGGECGFTRAGFIQIAARESEAALRANTHMLQEIGIPAFLISAADVRRLAPSFVTDDFDTASYEPESGYADPSATAASFFSAARDKGARLIQDCAVTGVIVEGGRVKGVQTAQGDFFAPVVVNAAGPWAGRVNAMVGLELPFTTWRHDTMFVGRPKEMGPSHPVVIDFPNEMYFRPETGNLTLVGLEDGNPLGEPPDSDTDHAQKGFVERAIERICQRIPAMESSYLHTAHGGYDGLTPDQHPLLGQAGPQGFYLQCGMSGTGFKIAPAVGLCMSELILDGAAKSVDISIYRPQRFAEGKEIQGNYQNIWH